MAIIPLRAYNREIEGLVENGQLDEAVAHCLHILATFPKYIACYRLLGKAHLEQQRVSDATDIFQRVLSAIPDDFIANVGMSIIREDENNLDASIWHMELAYEAQPSNVAIQDELRRLYGRRDGMQPPKVRLTRGALSRMYAKGGLFDQAIAELRAAISEDPNRPDLQLLLAQMYFQISQRVDAVETCVNILKKLPYCLVANQILAVSLPEAEQSEVIKNYRQNAIAMDPYFAFAGKDEISSDQVPENAVNVEKLEWKAGLHVSEEPVQPTWATSLGISLDKPVEEKLPDWLKEAEAPGPAESEEMPKPTVSPFIWDTQEVKNIISDVPKQEGDLPDWMKDAGWQPVSGEATEQPKEEKKEAPVTPLPEDAALEKGEIPDWLRGIAPDDTLEEDTSGSQSKGSQVSIPWLEKHEPGPTDSIIQWLEEKKPETSATPAAVEGEKFTAGEEEVPDWLKNLDVPIPSAFQGEEENLEAPAFISETPEAVQEPVAESPEAVELPELKQEETTTFVEISPEKEVEALIIPETEESPVPEVPKSEEVPAELADEIPDWLKELAGDETLPPAEVISAEQEAAELPPTEELPTIGEATTIEEGKPTEQLPVGEELPVVGEETAVEEMAPPEQPILSEEVSTEEQEGVPFEEVAEELPVVSEEVPAAEITIPSEVEPAIEAPASAKETTLPEIPVITEETPQIEQPALAEGEAPVEAVKSDTDVFAWLEGLAAEQGAKEEELITPTQERGEEPPEWVKLDVEPPTEEEVPAEEPQEMEAPAIPAAEIPDWIKGLGETAEAEEIAEVEPAPIIEAEIPQAEELPEWLQELEPPEVEKESQAQPPEALEWKEEAVPDWLKEIAEMEPSGELKASEQLPTTEEIPPTPAPVVSEPSEEAVQVGIPGEENIEEIAAEMQPTEPAWVSEIEAPEQPVIETPIEAELQPVAEIAELPAKEVELPETAPLKVPAELLAEAPETELVSLDEARAAINEEQPSKANEIFEDLIKENRQLEEVIKNLQEALYRFPVDIHLWMSLGDAYFRTDKLQDALKSYTKAEELVR